MMGLQEFVVAGVLAVSTFVSAHVVDNGTTIQTPFLICVE
jgi:hypothetical protein